MTRPTIRYKPGYRTPKKLEPKPPTASDPAAQFHLTRRFELYRLLTGHAPVRKRVEDGVLNRLATNFRKTHGEQEYRAVETRAYLLAYTAMAERLKQQRQATLEVRTPSGGRHQFRK
jgi:hypothetical protein